MNANATGLPGASRFTDESTPSKRFTLASMLAVLLVNGLDVVVPPLGIPLAILTVWLILRRTGRGWSDLGLRKQANWARTFALGLGLGGALYVAADLGANWLLQVLGIGVPDVTRFSPIQGDLKTLALWLTIAWTTAGFGEEVIWRGFMLAGVVVLLGGGSRAWWMGVALTAPLFGLAHFYQGLSGVLTTGLVAFAIGTIYLLCGRNLWIAFIVHATMNSIAFLLMFFGLELWRS